MKTVQSAENNIYFWDFLWTSCTIVTTTEVWISFTYCTKVVERGYENLLTDEFQNIGLLLREQL